MLIPVVGYAASKTNNEQDSGEKEEDRRERATE
jgi:hypothetical protein